MKRFYYDNTAADGNENSIVKFTAPPGLGFSKFTISVDFNAAMFLTADSIVKNEFAPLPANVPMTFDFSGDVYSIPEIFIKSVSVTPANVGLTVFEYGSKPNVNAFLSEE